MSDRPAPARDTPDPEQSDSTGPEPGNDLASGTWVEVHGDVLAVGERLVGATDTARTPLTARTRGFLMHPARLGQDCTVRTLSGRLVTGVLANGKPGHSHGFGVTQADLVGIVASLREPSNADR